MVRIGWVSLGLEGSPAIEHRKKTTWPGLAKKSEFGEFVSSHCARSGRVSPNA
jgi:hypothetical protein